MSRGLPRVLVLTGTSDHPFPRLMDALPALVRDGVAAEVRVQCSTPVPPGAGIVALGMLSRETLQRELSAADVVVTHGGSGSCFEAIRAGHRPIVVPRRAASSEHVDDHQLDVAEALAERHHAMLASGTTSEELARSLTSEIRGAPPRSALPARTLPPLGRELRGLLPPAPTANRGPTRPYRIERSDAAAYNEHYRSCPRPHPLQSVAWGEARRLDGWHPEWWLARDDRGRCHAGAQVLRRRIPGAPGYVPFGPALANSPRAPAAGHALLLRLGRAGAGGILWAPYAHPSHVPLIKSVRAVAMDRPARTGFVELGSDEEMLARMKREWRRRLRRGLESPGLQVVQQDAVEFVPRVLERVRLLAREKGFKPPIPPQVGREFAARAGAAGVRLVCIAVQEGGQETNQYVCSIVGRWAHTLWSSHEPSASDGAGRVALWTLMRVCRDAGCSHYDLTGIDDEGNPGVATFKRGVCPAILVVPGLRWIPPCWIPPMVAECVPQVIASVRGSRRPE